MIEAIIFDMDGVLVDSEPIHTEIEKRQFILNKLSVSDEEHQSYKGISSEMMWSIIAKNHRVEVPVVALIEQNRVESIRYFSELEEIPVIPGLIPLLEKIQQKKYALGVASSSFPEIIELILTRTGLKKYFQAIVSTEEAGKSKPNPDVFLLAAQKLGVNPKNCLVVEDSFNGIAAAHAAYMSCVAYQGPDADPRLQKEADAIVKNYEQLGMMV